MKDCPHEDNILYGKAIRINKLNRVVQVMCDSCRAYGTIYEQREKHSANNEWYEVREVWHQMKDYYPRHVVEKLEKRGRPYGFVHDITRKYTTFTQPSWFHQADGYSKEFQKKAYSFDGQYFYKGEAHNKRSKIQSPEALN